MLFVCLLYLDFKYQHKNVRRFILFVQHAIALTLLVPEEGMGSLSMASRGRTFFI